MHSPETLSGVRKFSEDMIDITTIKGAYTKNIIAVSDRTD
jgi:hypothetical protein